MSRCFPFPPPGYDKKIDTTDSELLKKEKDREKKHKKDKKDREKKEDRRKEDKEKRDKDRSDGKSKERKNKKERHRDKEKERDKEKQTNGASTSGKKTHNLFKEQNGQLFNNKNTNSIVLSVDRLPARTVDYNEKSHGNNHKLPLAVEANGAKVMQISDRKINNESNGVRIQTGEGVTTKRHNDGGGTFCQNTQLDNDFNDSNLAQELDRRLKDEAEQPYSPPPVGRKPIGAQQKRDGGVIEMVSLDSMDRGNHRIKDARENFSETKSLGATVVSNHVDEHEGLSRTSLGGNSEKGVEGHKRTKHGEDELHKRGEKRKDRNGEKKSHGKDKSRDKEKKVERGSSRGDQTKAEQSTREGPKMDILHGSPNHKMLHSGEYGENNLSREEKLKKAKEHQTNGFIHVTGPSKLSGPSFYNLQNVNGRAPEPCEIPVMSSPGQGATNNIKVDKVWKVNGIIETHVQGAAAEQAVKVQARQRSPHHIATEQVVQVQARPRSPHPDAKRLSEILSVPKMEELSDLDDTDWLFSSKEGPEKRHKVDDSHGGVSNVDAEIPQVWSHATNIESADVYALPYVIPY